MSEIVELKDTDAVPTTSMAITPMEMLNTALSNGAPIETLEKLMALQERWEANQARKAFVAAMANARAKFEPILKRHNGYNNRYKYEQLSDIETAVRSALSEHGITYEWQTEDSDDGRIRVTCIATHSDGHNKTNSLSCHPKDVADPKANMNGAQRIQTAVTYLERITLKALLGLAAGPDSDGVAGEQAYDTAPLKQQIDDAEDFPALAEVAEELNAVSDMPNSARAELLQYFSNRQRALKAELNNAE
ncbi:MAG: ERF family protein [Pseudomonadota bacterium]